MQQPERTPLTPISKSGRYTLRMGKINPQFIRQSTFDGSLEYAFFFTDQKNNSLSYKCSVGKSSGKSLAILIGKFSGQYKQPLVKTLEVDVEVVKQGVGQTGKPWFNYRLNFPKAAKPAGNDQPDSGAIPF
jgi:hypothetical protein